MMKETCGLKIVYYINLLYHTTVTGVTFLYLTSRIPTRDAGWSQYLIITVVARIELCTPPIARVARSQPLLCQPQNLSIGPNHLYRCNQIYCCRPELVPRPTGD